MFPKSLVWVTLSLLAGTTGYAQVQPSPAQVLIQRARLLDAQGRHDLAADNWRQVLLVEPRQPDGLEALGRYYRSTGDTARAQQYEGMLHRIRPSLPPSKSGNLDSGGDMNSMLTEASRLSSIHRYAEAVALYQRAFGSTQPPDNWAVAYFETEAALPASQPQAIAGLRSLAQKYPANPSFQLALARVLTYRPATRPEGVRMLAAIQGSPEQNEQARSAWKQAIQWDLGTPAALESSKQYLARYPDADLSTRVSTAVKQAVPVSRQDSPLEGEGYKALSAGDLETATEKFTALTELPGRSVQGHAGLGYVAMKRKDFATAILHFEQARAGKSKSAALDKALEESRYWQAMSDGNTALADKDTARAATEFERAHSVNGARPEATEALGGSLLADKDPGRAESVFAEALKANPHRPDTWIGWMNAKLENGNAAAMLNLQASIPADAKAALARRPDYLALLASAELDTGNSAAATRLLNRINQIAASSGGQGAAAQVRAAGLLLTRGYADQSAQLCAAVIKADRENADAWQTLVEAEHAAGRDETAVRVASQMPTSVDASAMENPDFLMALAAVYQDQQRLDTAAALLDHAATLSNLNGHADAIQLQRASLALVRGDAHAAYILYRGVQQQSPGASEAWSGMINALHAGKHDPEALATIERLSPSITARLRRDPSFLQTAAFIYSENGRTREAMLCLSAVTRYYVQQHRAVPFSVDTEYAWLLLNAGRDAELATTLARLADNPNLDSKQILALQQIWTTWSIRRAEAEYKKGDSKRALMLLQAAEQAYPGQPGLHSALANMYVRTGNPNLGMKLFLQMDWQHATVDQFQAAIDAALAAHSSENADLWLKLGLQQFPNDPTLLRAGARIEEQRGNLKKAMRYLMAVRDGGAPRDTDEATLRDKILAASSQNEVAVVDEAAPAQVASPQAELARMLGVASVRDTVLRSAGDSWTNPPAARPETLNSDVAASIQPLAYDPQSAPQSQIEGTPYLLAGTYQQHGAAVPSKSTRNRANSARPVWPGDNPSSPSMAPEPVKAGGDLLGELTSESTAAVSRTSAADPLANLDLGPVELVPSDFENKDIHARVQPVSSSGDTLQAILNGTDRGASSGGSFTDGLETERSTNESRTPTFRIPDPGYADSRIAAALPESSSNHFVETDADAILNSTQRKAADELAQLESRYTPWLATGGVARSHSGTPGFDQLQAYEGEIEASTVIGGGGARLTAISRPVLLQSGIPDSNSNYRFGSGSTASMPRTAQFASGLGAEVQLAARSLQLSFGISPSSFAVTNMIGSFALRPAQGPITFRAYRSNVKDSLLSYAGMKDPTTGQIWGGVIATGGAIEIAHGNADSGFYASVDGQKLTGKNVADNTRIMGNAGAYWMAYQNPFGHLKVGANMTAMHYALNQRYFTVGQGGYFSPDGFIMVNAPLTWEGRPIYNTGYTISGSLGAQNIQQGQALSGSLITGNGIETVSGASYDLHARIVHRMNEHWNVEAFFDTNNARQYFERSAGFAVRYMKFAQPVDLFTGGFINSTDIRPLQRP